MSSYKDNIIKEVGGKSEFAYAVTVYCQSIRDDSRLNVFFAHLDLDGLIALQTEFLDAAFLDVSPHETKTLVVRLALKHQTLWKMGMDETHFEQLKSHFVMALQGCWVEGELIQAAKKHFDNLRPLFEQSAKSAKAATAVAPIRAHHNLPPGIAGSSHQRTY